jgi:predicted RNase H-like nuclease (RuvC/YqgF family)
MSEGSANPGEGQKSVNLEELSAKLESLTASLEAEKKSKERILEESKRYKEGYQTYKAKEEEISKANAAKEEERLKKEGQFSTLLEQRESRIKELEDNLNNTAKKVEERDTAITNFRKAAAFERALGGKMKKDAYWDHVDFDSIALNPETGEIDSHSLRKTADSFIESFKELVDFGKSANLPNGTPSGSSGKLTHEQWKKLPLTERKKRMKDVVD